MRIQSPANVGTAHSNAMLEQAVDSGAPTWFGQPRGLTILFLTEMWEKFSFYGMRALLVYYMTKHLQVPQNESSVIYGLYSGLVYFTPLVGGLASDRWLGRRRSVVIGGLVMATGHFLMAFEPVFYAALIVIALGNGLYLPSVPSQVGSLYHRGDPRRDAAFNVYYVGVNLGAFIAPLVCGTLGELYGWHWGFGAAGIGMCLGVIVYTRGRRFLPPEPALTSHETGSLSTRRADEDVAIAARGKPLNLLAAVGVAVVVFRSAYEQIGNTVAIWADADVDRTVGPFVIPGSWFQALNPLLVMLLTPLLIRLWMRDSRWRPEMSPLRKMALGGIVAIVAWLLLAANASLEATTGTRVNWLWLATFILLLTVAELYVLPIGLSLFARLAPERYSATTIAAWYFAAFAGNLVAGSLGAFWSRTSHGTYFGSMAVVSAVAVVLFRCLDGPVCAVEAKHRAAAHLSREQQAEYSTLRRNA